MDKKDLEIVQKNAHEFSTKFKKEHPEIIEWLDSLGSKRRQLDQEDLTFAQKNALEFSTKFKEEHPDVIEWLDSLGEKRRQLNWFERFLKCINTK